jgi:F-type H+-transporting ATPase subunit b
VQLAYVLAQETAEHEQNPILPASNELIWGTVAFLILLFLMYRTVFPSINQAFKDRRANIEGKLEKAEKDREEAEQLLEQYRRRLRDAEDETQRILEEARSNAVELATRVVGDSLDRDRQLRLVDEYIDELGNQAQAGALTGRREDGDGDRG